MLGIKNLCFSVSDKAGTKEILNGINLTIKDNRFVVITGPNGGGKSTLAKLIMGIEKPTSGSIILNGKDITNLSVTERSALGIGFAFQQPVKFKGITVLDILRLASKRPLTVKQACEYLSAVGLCAQNYINREINASLSGGELKRIEIASVIATGSTLSIFDEPEAGIDLWSFNNLIQVFEDMQRTVNGSILIISHQERIFEIADEIVVVSDGKIQEHGSKVAILPKLMHKHSGDCSDPCDKCRTSLSGLIK